MSKLQFGWAEVDLTPEKKAALGGQFAERISEYVENRLRQQQWQYLQMMNR